MMARASSPFKVPPTALLASFMSLNALLSESLSGGASLGSVMVALLLYPRLPAPAAAGGGSQLAVVPKLTPRCVM
jgi:hypothetical protein